MCNMMTLHTLEKYLWHQLHLSDRLRQLALQLMPHTFQAHVQAKPQCLQPVHLQKSPVEGMQGSDSHYSMSDPLCEPKA